MTEISAAMKVGQTIQKMQRVLLVEDAEVFQEIVASALDGLGLNLVCVASAAEAWSQMEKENFDLLLLDVMLPDESGFEFCSRLRMNEKTRDVPVFFITGKADVSDKVTGFSLGADDYIVKPFDLNEFRARVTAKLEKVKRQPRVVDFLSLGTMKLDVAGQKLILSENNVQKPISLTPAEFRILYFLARHPGETVTGRQLMEAVWGKDLHVVDQNLYTHMHSLRKKLGNKASTIESVRGGGYRFIVPKE